MLIQELQNSGKTLSKPVKCLLAHGLLNASVSYFHYACEDGAELEQLKRFGVDPRSSDPLFRLRGGADPDIVNLGYTIGGIQDASDRAQTVRSAFALSKKLLVVAGKIHQNIRTERSIFFRERALVRSREKHFDQHELQQLVENAVGRRAIPATLGVFYVFRNVRD